MFRCQIDEVPSNVHLPIKCEMGIYLNLILHLILSQRTTNQTFRTCMVIDFIRIIIGGSMEDRERERERWQFQI